MPRQKLSLHVWLQTHQDLKIGFAERASELVPITREAIIFLLQSNTIKLDETAGLISLPSRNASTKRKEQGEIADCYIKAELVGRWFARAGTVTTIYAMWGVRP